MFNFSYDWKGIKLSASLPYDPMVLGLDMKKRSSCCLRFQKKDVLVRIKLVTKAVIVERVDEDTGISSSLSRGLLVPRSQEEYNEIITQWL